MALTATPVWASINVGNVTWSNMPSALTEIFGTVHRRIRLSLTDAHKARLTARVSTLGSANAVILAQYSLDESTWFTLTPDLALGGGVVGTRASAWGTIPAQAQTDVFIRVVGQNGDAVADPVLGNIQLEVR